MSISQELDRLVLTEELARVDYKGNNSFRVNVGKMKPKEQQEQENGQNDAEVQERPSTSTAAVVMSSEDDYQTYSQVLSISDDGMSNDGMSDDGMFQRRNVATTECRDDGLSRRRFVDDGMSDDGLSRDGLSCYHAVDVGGIGDHQARLIGLEDFRVSSFSLLLRLVR
jgi:hypothetical protein